MLSKYLQQARALSASDLHLSPGLLPRVRLQGQLLPLPDRSEPLTAAQLTAELKRLLSEAQWQQLERQGELDAAFTTKSGERCRLHAYRRQDAYALAVRLLAGTPPETAALGLPSAVERLAELQQGLVLVTGPTGSGKSTTLAALVQRINSSRAVHIITLEDPVEYLYPQGLALISQREIGRDTQSFASGLRSALRQDPDIILVGELRDSETLAIALTAAETGHLVLATLHTSDVVGSINRFLDALPEQQGLVRSQLAGCLQGVVSQRLLPRRDGNGRVAAFEVLLPNEALRNLIRENRTHQLQSYLQTGRSSGMQTFADAMAELRKKGLI